MKTFKFSHTREFFYLFIQIQSIKYKFNTREASIAAEFLFWANHYITNPLKVEAEIPREVVLEGEQEFDIVQITPPMIEQLKNTETLKRITANLEMSFTVFRKHVQGLKDKGFFDGGEIAEDFSTDGKYATFEIKYGKEDKEI